MSEHVLRVLLSELRTVRLRCQHDGCGIVFEMTLTDLAVRNFNGCPCCKRPLVTMLKDERSFDLMDLARAMQFIADAKTVGVEFVIPVKG